MIHRKSKHPKVVRICNLYTLNNCRFESKSCWYKHDQDSNVEREYEPKKDEKEKEGVKSIFRNISANLKPPNQQKKQKMD